MGKRTLSKAQVRQRLLALERRVARLERPVKPRLWRAHGHGYDRYRELASAAMSTFSFSAPAQDDMNDARSCALDRIQLLDKYRTAVRETWRLHAHVHQNGGPLRRGWRHLQLRVASRLLGFGARP